MNLKRISTYILAAASSFLASCTGNNKTGIRGNIEVLKDEPVQVVNLDEKSIGSNQVTLKFLKNNEKKTFDIEKVLKEEKTSLDELDQTNLYKDKIGKKFSIDAVIDKSDNTLEITKIDSSKKFQDKLASEIKTDTAAIKR